MGIIFLIGGGEIGYKGSDVETTKIDEEIINSCDNKNPNLLFIPTASGDSEGYIELIENQFGKKLGCNVNTLCLSNKNLNDKEIKDKIYSSDIIYIGGGNTEKMLEIWKKYKMEKYFLEAYKKGIILSGISAGAMCWFDKIYLENEENKTFNIISNKFNLISGIFIPHYDKTKEYKINNSKGLDIFAVSNNCAIKIIDNKKFEVLKSQKNAKAFLIKEEGNPIELKENIFYNI